VKKAPKLDDGQKDEITIGQHPNNTKRWIQNKTLLNALQA
jgi:hypothetical protein